MFKSLFSKKSKKSANITAASGEPGGQREGAKIEDFYLLKEELGSGGFALVRRGVDKLDKSEWALKLIKQSTFKKNRAQTEEEVSVLGKMKHEGIVQLRETVVTDKHFVIVMEILRGKELFDRIVAREKYNENDARIVARRIFEAIEYMHSNKFVHRDLKPENIIFADGREESPLKITDFGFATEYDKTKGLTQSCGTPEYVAPEIIDERVDRRYTDKVDIWSAGVIVYILLCGYPPFFADTDEELFDKIQHAEYDMDDEHWKLISKEGKDFIKQTLKVNPQQRMSASECLKHPWLGTDLSDAPDLSGARSELQRFNATRKLRRGVMMLVAANQLKLAVS